MKVLLIDVNCKSGSTGKIVYDLYTALRKNGDEAAICYGRGPVIEEPDICRVASGAEVFAHALLTRITGLTGCFSPAATRCLLNFIRQYQPDVVHIHELHGYFVNIRPLVRLLREAGIPTVWTFHCEFLYTGKCGYAMDCGKWETGCGHCPRRREYVSSWLLDFTHQMWNEKRKMLENWKQMQIAVPSQWLARRVRRSFLRDFPLEVVYNGINEEIFRPRDGARLKKHNGIGDEKIVLAAAPDLMQPRKGGAQVLDLARRMAGQKIRFILIGLRAEQVNSLNALPNVLALPRISRPEELAEYYSLADVFVICSQMENFPTTCLEAQCCGTTVCGFDAGGIRETVLYRPEDSLVSPGKGEALCRVIERRLEAIPPRDEIARQAAAVYGRERMFRRYRQLYSRAAER